MPLLKGTELESSPSRMPSESIPTVTQEKQRHAASPTIIQFKKCTSTSSLRQLVPLRQLSQLFVQPHRLLKDHSQSQVTVLGRSAAKLKTSSDNVDSARTRTGKRVWIAGTDHPQRDRYSATSRSGASTYKCHWHTSYLHGSFAEKRKCVGISFVHVTNVHGSCATTSAAYE
jgi:hypothetical protein